MIRSWRVLFIVGIWLGAPSAMAFAQASIAGSVKDTSGAVLPGVTVEAASPALIEKVRSVTTDGSGQYRIVDLRPGVYTVTFTLAGFNAVKREGLTLTGSFTATLDAELRVGALTETITVTGETPLVDVQGVTKQRVLDTEVINAIPGGAKTYGTLAMLIPGVSASGGGSNQDVGGSQGGTPTNLTARGSRTADARVTMNGVSVAVLDATSSATPNPGATQEVTIDTAAVSAELPTGGPRVNYIPRDGGNNVSGFVIGSFTNSSLQSDNFSDDLQTRGLRSADSVREIWDFNPGLGGPLKRDRVWFFATGRHFGSNLNAGGMFYNANAENPNAWTYEADTSRPASNRGTWKDAQGRLTWQATPRNKVALTTNWQTRCNCPSNVGIATVGVVGYRSPEASFDGSVPQNRSILAEWSSPLTNRLLFEAVGMHRLQYFGVFPPASEGYPAPGMISTLEQSNNLTFRANEYFQQHHSDSLTYRAAVSYITGAHALKIGFNNAIGSFALTWYHLGDPVNYRLNNGVPNQVTIWNTPYTATQDMSSDIGLFVQDRWTIDRLTLTAGIRYDAVHTGFPEQHLGPTSFNPTQDLTFAAQDNLNWKNVTPRVGVVYDLFGTGKTAVKASANQYLQGQGLGSLGSSPNPVNTLVQSTSRQWTDANRNFVPDCNLGQPTANGECGQLNNLSFGQQGTTTFDPDLLTGWNTRASNWEFSAGLQHQLLPRVGVDLGWFRRVYEHFQVTDNLLVTPADYASYSLTAPRDARLQNGGGYVVSGLYNVNPNKLGQVLNYNTLSDKYGAQSEHWNGGEVSVNARLSDGFFLQGGVSAGRTVTDNCEIVAQLPEMLTGMAVVSNASNVLTAGVLQSESYCHMAEPFLTQVKLMGAYTVPRIDVQMSGTLQSIPGPLVQANYVASNAEVAPSLGRSLAGGANVTVNLAAPGTLYGERLTQLDLRFAKIVRLASRRLTVNVDVYNAMNADTVTQQNDSFGDWQRPLKILQGRFVKFGAQFDF